MAQELSSRPEVAALIARGEERGCINLSEFDELAQSLELVDEDVEALEAHLEAQGVRFVSDTMDSGVCHQAIFLDPTGNALNLHHRYAPNAN